MVDPILLMPWSARTRRELDGAVNGAVEIHGAVCKAQKLQGGSSQSSCQCYTAKQIAGYIYIYSIYLSMKLYIHS